MGCPGTIFVRSRREGAQVRGMGVVARDQAQGLLQGAHWPAAQLPGSRARAPATRPGLPSAGAECVWGRAWRRPGWGEGCQGAECEAVTHTRANRGGARVSQAELRAAAGAVRFLRRARMPGCQDARSEHLQA